MQVVSNTGNPFFKGENQAFQRRETTPSVLPGVPAFKGLTQDEVHFGNDRRGPAPRDRGTRYTPPPAPRKGPAPSQRRPPAKTKKHTLAKVVASLATLGALAGGTVYVIDQMGNDSGPIQGKVITISDKGQQGTRDLGHFTLEDGKDSKGHPVLEALAKPESNAAFQILGKVKGHESARVIQLKKDVSGLKKGDVLVVLYGESGAKNAIQVLKVITPDSKNANHIQVVNANDATEVRCDFYLDMDPQDKNAASKHDAFAVISAAACAEETL